MTDSRQSGPRPVGSEQNATTPAHPATPKVHPSAGGPPSPFFPEQNVSHLAEHVNSLLKAASDPGAEPVVPLDPDRPPQSFGIVPRPGGIRPDGE
jgi:hypothetical protein